MILYFRFLAYIMRAYLKPKIGYCSSSSMKFRVLPMDCASKTMNNARFFSFADIAQHENNVRSGFLRAAFKNNWRVVIRNSRITYFKPLKMFESFQVTSQVVGWDERFFYWRNSFLNKTQQCVAESFTAVSVRNRKERTGVSPLEIVRSLDPNLKPSMTAAELQKVCGDLVGIEKNASV